MSSHMSRPIQTNRIVYCSVLCAIALCLPSNSAGQVAIDSKRESIARQPLSPRGGEVFQAGSVIPISWHPDKFIGQGLLKIDVWDMYSGEWQTVLKDLANNGHANIVLGPMEIARLRIVSTDNNQILESGGYIAVLQSDITLDPKRDPTADGSSANGVNTNILTVHEASLVLQSIEMLNASILAYSYDGKRLPDHNDGRDVLASLNETQLVLFHINRSSTPPTVTLIVQR